ncbi:carbohydrate ABC transporter permease [Demequina sp. NBRC 110054]|uniref:carbohydrate ABC transporter permease n=1 Tax=Demequina sp. NBRC 110054 TaxID=1570343 RepID=UPI0013564901|nr:sugar ABC transporter permease [Demequina sp. NBRC 110054]
MTTNPVVESAALESAGKVPRKRRRQRTYNFQRHANRTGWLFAAPGLAILLAFVFYPAGYAFWISLTDSSGLNEPTFIGFDNYVEAFTDPDSLNAIWNTVIYAVAYTPIVIAVALFLAIFLNRKDLLFRGGQRTVIFMPFIISMAVAALSWSFIINPNTGLMPYWFSKIGINLPDLLNDTTWAMPTVIFVAVWKNFGYFMVIFIAGLQGIPSDQYEAASLDGANAWQQFTNVTLPGLRPTMTYVIIVAVNTAFQTFDQIYIMTNGGPLRSTETIVYRVYVEGFSNFNQGYASALSFVLMAITLTIGLIQLSISRKQERDLV